MTAFRWTRFLKSNFRTTVKVQTPLWRGWLKAAQYLNRGNCLHGSTQHCWLWVHCDARDDVCSCVKTNRDVHADTGSSSFQWAAAVNRCKTRMLPLDSGNCLEIIIGLFSQWIWVGLCIYCVFWSNQTWVVSCTSHCITLGNLRNFHLRGVETLKRDCRFPLSQ